MTKNIKNNKDKIDNKWNLSHARWQKRNNKLPDQSIKSKSDFELDQMIKVPSTTDRNKNDKFTNIIREFNSFVKNDNRVEKIILPIGDGVTICKKV